jgi:predicted metalloprotease with PDZ domain
LLILAGAIALASPAAAQPQPAPAAPPTPPARDAPYPGLLRIEVDATDLDHRIFQVREVIPVAGPGPLTLLYPQWLPGHHNPTGPIEKLGGLVIRAGGRDVPWRRDPVDVFAFHLDVPPGAETLEVAFQFLSPTAHDQGRVVMTPEMLNLQWNAVVLYPAGHFARNIQVEPAVRLPDGWSFGTALEPVERPSGGVARFKATDLDTLVDSPIFAGRYYRQVDLDPGAAAPVRLDVFADRPELLNATPDELERHRELVRQAYRLFGSRHFDHYDFLFALTDRMGGVGLEHHRSSEDGTDPDYFADWGGSPWARDLLAHEFTHSWNGKFRRPADLWTPNFNTPMRGSLLWVYEGQTQYWGLVLAGRSGLLTRQESLDALAATAAAYEARAGRVWRSLEDTTSDPVVNARRPLPWMSWQRAEDYYSEGQLVWLDADTLIRARSGGKRSLDDVARAFFGVDDGQWGERTYGFEDVVAALNAVEPYDWATFLRERVDEVAPKAPLDGLARGGWRLAFAETATPYFRSTENRRKVTDLTYSIGLAIGRDGDIGSVLWNSPAFQAGLAVGVRIIAVNAIAYDADRLKDAITAAKTGGPIDLLVRSGDRYRTVSLNWKGGLRYPRLERIADQPDLLSAIYAPRRP